MAVGDSSGSQSPLSFGGFGAMLRHLDRLQQGIHEALAQRQLDRAALALLQPYQPNLAVTWLFQKAMIPPLREKTWDPDSINRLLSRVFEAMFAAGPQVVKPFLQDVVQFGGLAQALWGAMSRDPRLGGRTFAPVGVAGAGGMGGPLWRPWPLRAAAKANGSPGAGNRPPRLLLEAAPRGLALRLRSRLQVISIVIL
jgi:lycopene cyclase CruP